MYIEQIIKSKADLVSYAERYTELHDCGGAWRGCCPIHNGNNDTSFVIYPNGMYHCYACGCHGDIIDFVREVENLPHHEAVLKLAKEFNVPVENNKEYQQAVDIVEKYETFAKSAQGQVGKVKEYLMNRGFTEQTIRDFGFGYKGDNLIIPIRDWAGRTVAIAQRQFDKTPKYINSYNNDLYDKSMLLFNIDKARKLMKEKVYLVEGYMDAISGHQFGVPTLAYCSAEIHKDQVKELARYMKEGIVIYSPDNDEAGRRKLARVRQRFQEFLPKVHVRVLHMPEGVKDMNDLLVKGIHPDTLETSHIDKAVLKNILDSSKTKEQEFEQAEVFVRSIKNLIVKTDCLKLLSERWGQSLDDLKRYFSTDFTNAREIMSEFSMAQDCIDDLKRIHSTGNFKTYFSGVDNCIGGISKKQVLVIGAYSSAGKSDIAIELMLKAILNNKLRVVFFSLEMPKGKVMERIIAKIMKVPLRDVAKLLHEDDVAQQVLEKLGKNMIVIDKNNLSMEDIEKRIELINSKEVLGGPVDMVIVDYFTYIQGASTYEGASEAALRLKAIAKENDLIMVMLSQLNRGGSQYEEPTMRLLRMTGDLEASADVILLVWRPDKAPNLSLEEEQRLRNITRMKVEKARDGVYGSTKIELRYNTQTSRFEEIENNA